MGINTNKYFNGVPTLPLIKKKREFKIVVYLLPATVRLLHARRNIREQLRLRL